MTNPNEADDDANETLGGKGIETAEAGRRKLGAVVDGADTDDVEILGWTVFSTIGPNFTVPRDWLEQRMNELDIGDYLPRKVSERRAFKRAAKFSHQDTHLETDVREVNLERVKKSNIESDAVDERFDLYVKELDDDGEWGLAKLGEIELANGKVGGHPTIEPEHEHWNVWNEYMGTMLEDFERFQEVHLGDDIQNSYQRMQGRTNMVKMRSAGAVYFAPAQYERAVLGFKELLEDINEQWKNTGREAELVTVEVIDSEEKREVVEEKVRARLDAEVESVIDAALERLDEEEVAEDVAQSVVGDLVEADQITDDYEAILDTKISVGQRLKEWRDKVTGDEKTAIVEEIMMALGEEQDKQESLDDIAQNT